jgi:transposase
VARYGKAFKDKAVARLLPPESGNINAVAGEIGVSVATLERWRSEALGAGKTSGGWTPAARLDAVITTASMSEEQRAGWCRSKGIFPSELDEWKAAATSALSSEETVIAGSSKAERRRIRELERELRRKEKALAETAALLVLSKKLEAIFHKDADA